MPRRRNLYTFTLAATAFTDFSAELVPPLPQSAWAIHVGTLAVAVDPPASAYEALLDCERQLASRAARRFSGVGYSHRRVDHAEPRPDRARPRRRPRRAVAWAGSRDERLDFRLLWPEPLLAVTLAGRTEATVPARKLRILVDADLTSWQAWNDFATEFAEATGARLVHIDDGGIAGTAFHDRAIRINAPVLMSPKRHFDRLPARLRTRPVVDPCPLRCWSLVTRANDERESIAAQREHAVSVIQPTAPPTAPAGPIWLPSDPHRDHIRSLG